MSPEPVLTALHKLHPTQLTVGMIEVRDKFRLLAGMRAHKRLEHLRRNPLPVVRGPDGHLFVTDHHHLALAAWDVGVEDVYVETVHDWSNIGPSLFWLQMRNAHLVHPIDERGELRPYRELPWHLTGLRDDVFRSIAAYVRDAGGFEKTAVPFAEFAWADWFRKRLRVGPGRAAFAHAVGRALLLAREPEAWLLPGYIGRRRAVTAIH